MAISSADTREMTKKTPKRTAALLTEIAEGLVNDSGSETDLDLPEPDSFLIASSPLPTRQQKREIVLAPETPPHQLPSENHSSKDLLQPSVHTVYSAKSTPRSSKESAHDKDTVVTSKANSSRSLNEQFEQQKRKQPPKPTSMAVDSSASSSKDALTSETKSSGKSTRQKKIKMALDAMKADDASEPTPRKRSRRATKQSASATRNLSLGVSILTTGLSDTQLKRIQKSIRSAQLNLTIHKSATPLLASSSHQCTHLVAATTGGKGMRATRTFKYLAGLVLGAKMVSSGWLFDSVKAGEWLDESSYAIEGDTALPQFRLPSSHQSEALFDKYQMHVCCEGGAAYSRDDLVSLIKATGATVAELPDEDLVDADELLYQEHASKKRVSLSASGSMAKDIAKAPAKYRYLFELPIDQSRPIVLVDSNQLNGARSSATLGNIVKAAGNKLPYRTTSWLFDCLSANQIF
ncbi:hypothetical protein IWW36_000790 [Coemansia brasiliensis]|uniref:BRCT domain-containing protein n=1 Tax=Coemansia brasiliensis TaxID=2650707 RepID=A0A9W8IGQ4_9FUNG|nr:hypothetical protein IWW36_000790 [Coemansia brasiliensis]